MLTDPFHVPFIGMCACCAQVLPNNKWGVHWGLTIRLETMRSVQMEACVNGLSREVRLAPPSPLRVICFPLYSLLIPRKKESKVRA